MVDKKLVKYVRRMVRAGYPYPSIRNQLQQSGVSQADIEKALREGTTPQVTSLLHIGSPVVLIAIALLVAFAGIGYFIVHSSSTPAVPFSIEVRDITTQVSVEEYVEVSVGRTTSTTDASLTIELLDAKNARVIASDLATLAANELTSTVRLLVPTDTPSGTYVLRVVATQDGRRSVGTTSVTVQGAVQQVPVEPEQPVKPVPTQNPEETVCDDFDVCTTDTKQNGECVHTPITPCCSNGVCEEGEREVCLVDCPRVDSTPPPGLAQSATLEEISDIAKSDPNKAASLCEEQTIPDYKDTCYSNIATQTSSESFCESVVSLRIKDVCFSEVAKQAKSSTTCQQIVKEDRRDSCYLTFVLDFKDYTVCEKIVNDNLRQSCEALRQLQ